jgi:trans-aconitate methyltransferase
VRHWSSELGLGPGASVFEVGCGAGAFLYELDCEGCVVGGIDQSETLVRLAREALPAGTFDVADASELDPTEPADAVVSCGMFPYLPSLDDARAVIVRMTGKARRAVAILDIPDRATQELALRYRKASAGGDAAYAERYRGLEHRYYERAWVVQTLQQSGLIRVQVADQSLPGYGNAPFRFNAWGFKPAG